LTDFKKMVEKIHTEGTEFRKQYDELITIIKYLTAQGGATK
jgi:hypothetical protein